LVQKLTVITTKITKVESFQETICKPNGSEALLRLIRCQPSKDHGRAAQALENLTGHVGDLLDQLQADDFELLIELIFSSSGWRRISPVGGIQKFVDMALLLPTTGEKCAVQVKSQTTRSTLAEYAEKLRGYSGYSRMFFCLPYAARAISSAGTRYSVESSRDCKTTYSGRSR
jgi:hypothetical protein